MLLVQRGGEPYQGWWTLPAGYVEYGEDAAETAVREVAEETGLEVQLTGLQGIYFGGGDPRGLGHLAVFVARLLGGTLMAGDDAGDAQWFAPDEIPTAIAFEGHRKALALWQYDRQGNHQPGPRDDRTLLFYAGTGPAPPMLVYAIIENPVGTTQRIRYDEARQDFSPTNEPLPAPMPFHYGWVPRTLAARGTAPLGVVVVGEGRAAVGAALCVRPIGLVRRIDDEPMIVAVRADLPSAYAELTTIADEPTLQGVIADAFASWGGFEGWGSAAACRQLILVAQENWIRQQHGVPLP